LPETQASGSLPGILASIVETKRQELVALQARAEALEKAAAQGPTARGFAGALRQGDAVALIAECKRRSPGAGEIRPGLDPAELTRAYQRAGASALSVLTDRTYFGGSLDDLRSVRAHTTIPILRKDFTLHPLHVLEARAAGADAVLLIVRILDDESLRALLAEARGVGLDALVEVHDARDLERALGAGADIVGINNRDLATFTTDLDTTMRLLGGLPADVVVVSESGIRTPEDVARLGEGGVDAVLVGETLLRGEDPGEVAGSLAGLPRKARGHA
jgi:indole-3-glycerol phosphate synthase